VLVWFSSSAHPEKRKSITRRRKVFANDVGLALSFAASDTDVAPHFLAKRKYLRISRLMHLEIDRLMRQLHLCFQAAAHHFCKHRTSP
jgi:hypothetical protein